MEDSVDKVVRHCNMKEIAHGVDEDPFWLLPARRLVETIVV
jgi:hypothetical protein